jgi:glutathione S-transferase
MITLYGFPMSCSLAPHIALRATGQPFELAWVSLPAAVLADGSDYSSVHPRRQVPALRTGNGEILTETPAILQYIADEATGIPIAPPNGTFERVRLQEAMNYFAAEVHKQVLWQISNIMKFPWPVETHKRILLDLLAERLDYLTSQLGTKEFFLGNAFTVADAYMVVIFYWAQRAGTDLSLWPVLEEYRKRLYKLPAVKEAVAIDMAEQKRILDAGGKV